MLELLWFDPKSAARIRRRPPWRRILDEAAAEKADEPALPNQGVPPEERRDVLLVLARGEATDGEGASAAVSAGIRDDGVFAPPLLLLAGELRFAFDEVETLKGTVTTATPFMGGDEPLKATVDAAKDFLATPGLLTAPAVVEALAGRIRDAFGRTKRAVPAGYLEAQTERALLEQRHYQKRVFAGAPSLRALLQAPADKGSMLAYLPADVASKLPLYQRFPARLVAEAHLSADQYESHPFALKILALARQIPPAAPAPARRG